MGRGSDLRGCAPFVGGFTGGCLVPILSVCIPFFGPGMIQKGFREKQGKDLESSTVYGKQIRALLKDEKFFGGQEPGPVDLSLYGAIAVFVEARTKAGLDCLQNCDLRD